MAIKIPKYVQDLISRSEYCYDTLDGYCEPGYMIRIKKYSHYQQADTFNSEIDRLQKWVNKQPGGECKVLRVPVKTIHKHMQYATVIIYDPVMKCIENFIKF